MKLCMVHNLWACVLSLPVRGAWVEIITASYALYASRRSPCGERGLKFFLAAIFP